MNRRIALVPVAAVLLAMAGSLWAQTDATGGEPNEPATPDAAAQAPAEQESRSQAESAGNAGESRDSPFDYEASEQISEGLSVSFPVDI